LLQVSLHQVTHSPTIVTNTTFPKSLLLGSWEIEESLWLCLWNAFVPGHFSFIACYDWRRGNGDRVSAVFYCTMFMGFGNKDGAAVKKSSSNYIACRINFIGNPELLIRLSMKRPTPILVHFCRQQKQVLGNLRCHCFSERFAVTYNCRWYMQLS